MAQFAPDALMDAALGYIAAADTLTICSQQPATYAEATATYKLADVTLTPGDGNGDYTIADGDASGRKVTVTAQSGITIDTGGSATHVALCLSSDTTLRLVTTCTPQTLTATGKVTVPAWRYEIPDPGAAPDALVTQSTSLLTSNTDMGLFHVDQSLITGNETAEATAMTNLTALPNTIFQATHIQGFGPYELVPWDGVTPATPPDTSVSANVDFFGSISFGGTYTGSNPHPSSLDAQLKRLKDIGGTPIIVLYYFPWWMTGTYNSGGTTLTDPPGTIPGVNTNFVYTGRIRTDRWQYWLNLVERIVRRYGKSTNNSLGIVVDHYVIGQEYKGWTYNPDGGQRWDNRTYAGTAGENADMGFGYFYNETYKHIKAIAATISPALTTYVGGPYVPTITYDDTLDGHANALTATTEFTAAGGKHADHPCLQTELTARHGRAPYGRYRKQETRAWIDFLAAVDSDASSGLDFVTCDDRIENKNSSNANSTQGWLNGWTDWEVQRAKWADIRLLMEWAFTEAGHNLDNYDVYSMEMYLSHELDEGTVVRSPEYRNALQTSGMAELIKTGIRVPFLWGAWGEAQGDEPNAGILTETDVVGGGVLQPFYYSYFDLATHFRKGRPIYDVTVTGDSAIHGVSSNTHILVWNESADTKTALVEGQYITLTGYDVQLVAI